MVDNTIQIKSGLMINVVPSIRLKKTLRVQKKKKDYIWHPATCSCKNSKYLASTIDESVITCNEIIDAEGKSYNKETKTVATNFNEKKATCKTQNFYILLAFY